MEALTQPNPGTAPARTLIPLEDVPELARVSRTARWRLAKSGALRCYRVGGKIFTSEEDVRVFLAAAVIKGGAANG